MTARDRRLLASVFVALSLLPILPADVGATGPWTPDRDDGTYQNPVLFADYSDPDAIRVGDEFYLTASSFHCVPGLPVLRSKDLVNWTLLNHALPVQVPAEHFSKPRHGQGVWAPAIRHHDGKFWIYYPDPDFGLYLTTATDPAGAWSPPALVKAGTGLIDPCPLWDDDGKLYLVHGWAKSRAGIANLLTLHELSADGTRVLDAGKTLRHVDGRDLDVGTIIIDGAKIPDWHTIEGPKFYKRAGWYYVFAPAGGVATGCQAVFRARDIRGPYEPRIVLEQGATPINGPHQGAWVDTASGADWFLHFQDRGPYGRVVHLQPMRWRDDGWPVMGDDPDGDGKGVPVLAHRKPAVGRAPPVATPATGDEFDAPTLGLQWQWNANPGADWASLTARPGFLRLRSVAAPASRNDGSPAPENLYDAPNFLLQKFPAETFAATTALEFAPRAAGDFAGLAVFGYSYAILGVRRTEAGLRLELVENRESNKPGARERLAASIALESGRTAVQLRVEIDAAALARFSYSPDGAKFTPLGAPFQCSVDRWIGAKVGLIATAAPAAKETGHADFAWFRVGQAPR